MSTKSRIDGATTASTGACATTGAGGAAVAVVHASLDLLAAVAPWQLSDGEVAAAVADLESLSRRLAGLQLRMVAEGLSRGLPASTGSGTGPGAPGRWVRSLISITPGEAARRAILASILFTDPTGPDPTGHGELAPTRDAVLAGAISIAHAVSITTAISDLQPPATPAGLIDPDTLAEAQTLLLDAATGTCALDPTQLAKLATTLTATLDPSAGERLTKDEDRQHERRSLSLTPLPTGMFHLAGLLTNVTGHKLFTALQAFGGPRAASDGTPDPRTASMRMHDAAEHVADLILTADASSTLAPPASHGSPVRLVVTVTAETLLAQLGSIPGVEPPTLPGRWPLSTLSAQTMACDSDLIAVLTGAHGHPLDVGHTQYPFPRRIRQAIITRDGHCTFGTCTSPPEWCHVHHLDSYANGGPTSAANGALLCGAHHRYVHAQNLLGTLTSHGQVTWQTPAGQNPHAPPPAAQRLIRDLTKRWLRRRPRVHENARGPTDRAAQ